MTFLSFKVEQNGDQAKFKNRSERCFCFHGDHGPSECARAYKKIELFNGADFITQFSSVNY